MSINRLFRYLAVISAGLCLFSHRSFAQCGGLSLTPSSANFTGAGGAGSFTATGSTCLSWQASSNSTWITVTFFNGSGSGNVNYQVSANPDLIGRSGQILVTPTSGPVTQELISQGANAGDFSISPQPTSQTVPRGSNVNFTLVINRTGGFTGQIAFSTPGLPSGVTSSFNGNILTLRTDPGMATGPAPVVIQGV